MSKNIVIAAGGTGGHLFPAQALANELKVALPDSEILFLAKGLHDNRCFSKELFAYRDVRSSTLSLCPRILLRACVEIPWGICQSVKALKEFRPDLVIGFGSYHTFPVLSAAYWLKLPIVLHVADCVPGRVNRLFAKDAAWTGVFFPEAEKHLKGTVRRTSIPLRPSFHASLRPTRSEALDRYGLSHTKKTVLIFGGSQGAKKLNYIAQSALCTLTPSEIQVLHFTGKEDDAILHAYAKAGITAVVRPFEQEMHYPWAVADLVIARAGASTIAEQIAFQVPALLIPYPHAQDQHQDKNARFVEEVIGGAKRMQESELEIKQLVRTIEELLSEPSQQKMRHNLQQAHEAMYGVSFSQQIIDYLVGAK